MDTIVYKLHNPTSYPIIEKAVGNLQGGRGMLHIPDEEILRREKSWVNAWFNIPKDSFQLMQYNVKAHLPSGAAGVNINYDKMKEVIRFELSVPKFFFANNVCELIPPVASNRFNASDLSMVHLGKYWHKMLKLLFEKIIHDLTRGLVNNFSWTDVQISRIDIAFNQLFDTKEESLHYLESVKRVTFPRLKEGSKVGYATADTHLTDDLYFKCYHKGTEFARTGRKQVLDNYDKFVATGVMDARWFGSSNMGLSIEKIDDLQAVADRTLRYELECKSGLMKSLFNSLLKKQHIPEYGRFRKAVRYCCDHDLLPVLKAVVVRDGDFYLPEWMVSKEVTAGPRLVLVTMPETVKKISKGRKLLAWLKANFLIRNYVDLQKAYKFLCKEDDVHHQFFFDIIETDAAEARPRRDASRQEGTMGILEPTPIKQRFSVQLLQCCIAKHNEFFKLLQFEQMPAFSDVEKLCIEYNLAVDKAQIIDGKRQKKVHVSKVLMLVKNLQAYTWSELKKNPGGKVIGNSGVTRMTVYNWQKTIDKVFGYGRGTNFVSGINLHMIVRSPMAAYSRHYDEMLMSKNVLGLFLQNTSLFLTV